MDTRLTLRIALLGGTAASLLALAPPAHAVHSTGIGFEETGGGSLGPCTDSNLNYSLVATGSQSDGDGYDYFGVLVLDGDDTPVDNVFYRVPDGDTLGAYNSTYFGSLDGDTDVVDHRLIQLRLYDIDHEVELGMSRRPGSVELALSSPVLSSAGMDLGLVYPQCEALPYDENDPGPSPPPPSVDEPCPAGTVVPFVDVDPSSVHAADVACAAMRGLVHGGPGGLPDDRYGPLLETSRGQLASLVANLLAAVGVELPASPPNAFADDDGSVHAGSIDQLAALGVLDPDDGPAFDPFRAATRSEMASLMAAAYEAAVGAPLPAGPDAFGDDDGDPAEDAIDALAAAGIVSGVGGGAYAPTAPVSREQIATFFVHLLVRLED